MRRPPGHVLDPQIKSINYLNLVLAKLEAKAAGADEALLLDVHGRLCEVSGCNIFVVTAGGCSRRVTMFLQASRARP